MSEPALEAKGLTKHFGGLLVNHDVGITLAPGARRALIGPNGAGKTTLVGILSGVIRPDTGTIAILGHDVTEESPSRRAKRGLVRTFQVSSLFAKLSVLENVFLAVSEHAGASADLWRAAGKRRALVERAESVIEQLRLGDDRHRCVAEIAYGRQRLVEIAIALALEPKVLLLDEPAAGIPTAEVGTFLTAVEGLSKDIAILMIEHDMQIVRRFATEVTVMVHGKVMMTGSPLEIMASAEVQAVYLGTSGRVRFGLAPSHA
jgi:branched-chain amino acid transport system ATP-binding protein